MGIALTQRAAQKFELAKLGEIRRQAILAQPESFWSATEKLQAADAWNAMEVHAKFDEYKILIFSYDQKDVGFVGWKNDYLGYIFILPNYQSTGLGGQALKLAEAEIRKAHNQIWLWAHPYSEKFYLKNGFIKTDETEIPFGSKPLYKFLKKLISV